MKDRDGQDVNAGRWVGSDRVAKAPQQPSSLMGEQPLSAPRTTTTLMSGLRGRRAGVIVLSAVLLTSAAAVTAGAPAEAVSPTKIVYEAPAAGASAGTPVNVAGMVSPATESRTVYLQQHSSGAWRRVATTRTARGAFTLPLPTKTTGTFTYRLAVTAGADGASAETRSITFRVTERPEDGNPEAYRFLTSGGTPAEPIARWNPCRDIGYRVNLANSTAGALTAAGQGGAQWYSAQDSKGRPASMITEGYVVLNATMTLSGGFGTGPEYGWTGTRGQLLMHELGHAVGLDHPTIKDKVQIMSPTMSSMPAVWGAGDRNGLRLVGESAGCIRPT